MQKPSKWTPQNINVTVHDSQRTSPEVSPKGLRSYSTPPADTKHCTADAEQTSDVWKSKKYLFPPRSEKVGSPKGLFESQ